MRYEVWYADQNGAKLELLDTFVKLEYAIVDGDVGTIIIDMPDDTNRVYSKPIRDNQVQVFRGATGATLQLETVGLTRKFTHKTSNDGLKVISISSPDLNELTARRIVAYQENATNGSYGSDEIDSIMYDVALNNLGATDRLIASGLGGYSNGYRNSNGPSTSIKAAWKEVRKVLQDLQNTSRALGNEVFWRITPVRLSAPSLFRFDTYVNQPGADRSINGSNPVIFSTEFGNLTDIEYVDDFSSEVNYIYGGGRNVGQSKLIGTAQDDDLIGRSKWNRREGFINASGAQSTAEIEQVAGQALNSMRPKRLFKAKILSTQATPYGGNGWRFGDRVTISDSGVQFDAIIRSVHVVVDGDGKEDISASVEGDIFI